MAVDYPTEFHELNRPYWDKCQVAFEQLRRLIETANSEGREQSESSEEEGDEEDEEINPASARAASIPIVKLLAIGTHLLGVTPTGESLPCLAIGTIDPFVFVDVFWETVAAAEEDLQLHVFHVHDGLFELSLGGIEFKVLYRQCNDLLRRHLDITTASSSFLEDPSNGCSHISALVEGLKMDRQRLHNSNIKVARASYHIARTWALARGRMSSGDPSRQFMMPKEILNIIFDFLASNPKSNLDGTVKNFLKVADTDYSGAMATLHQIPVFSSNSNVEDWPALVKNLSKVPMREVMAYPNYLQISVLFTCSGMRGAQWLSMVEQRLWTITKSASDSYTIWPGRLEAEDEGLERESQQERKQETPYEGFYVVGYTEGSFIINAIDKMVERAAKDKDNVPGECFLTIKSIKSLDFDTVFTASSRKWPRKAIPNPLEKDLKDRARSELPIRPKTKKVFKDGRKSVKDESTEKSEAATTKLRPASDVLTRLKYDSSLDIDQFVVGYVDRHTSKMQEKAAASWQRDTTHEEFIPEHRIQYFKRTKPGSAGEVMWDRGTRFDKIFGET